MITYELAKQLNDAGFPQEDKHWYWASFTYPNTLWCINALENKHLDKEYECLTACPTLSELIEACGDKFTLLERYIDKGVIKYQSEYIHMVFGHGSTPEEAVANLWLELNKK